MSNFKENLKAVLSNVEGKTKPIDEGEIARSYEIFKDIMEAGNEGYCPISYLDYREQYLKQLENENESEK